MATHFAKRLGTTGGLLIGGFALVLGWLMLDASSSLAQDGMQPASARMLLKGARELYAQGRYEEADGYYRRALLSRDSLTPSEQHDLEAQLQQNAIALQTRQAGVNLIGQAQQALLAGKADEAESYMRLAQANQFLAPTHKQQLAGMQQSLIRLRSTPADADGKSLLVRARESMAQGDYSTAEMLARQAEKQSSIFAPLAVWQDSPRAVLNDIRAARAKLPPGSAPSAITTNYTPMQPGTTPGAAPGQDKSQVKAVARQLVFDGYKALEGGDLANARRLGEQARSMNAGFEEWEPNPDRLLADVQRQSATAQAMAGATDARGMLRQARNLFQQQRLDEAEKLAVQAENMPNSRWGLFEDSPRKLRDEIVRSRSQMDSDRANKLTLEARAALKRGDVAQARVQAQQAKSLQGTSSVFAMWADTPDAVLRDVARAEKLHPNQTPTNPNMPPPLPDGAVVQMAPTPQGGLPIAPAPTIYSAEANNAAKNRAIGLLVEARQLGKEGHLAEARMKALEAEKVPAIWSPAEDCPGAVLRDLDTRASARIKELLDQATDLVLKNAADPTRFEKADGYLLSARRLAESFRLDSAVIDQKSQWIQQVANQSRLDPTAPGPIIRAAQAPGRSTSEMSEPVVRDAAAKLDQARRELRAGDTELARKLAVDAFALVDKVSPQMVEEASRVLHSIDEEEHAQTILSARRNFMNAMEAYRQKDYRQSAMLLSSFDLRLLPPDQVRRVEEIMSTPEMLSVQARSRSTESIKQTAAVTPGATSTPTGPAGKASISDLEDPQIAALREAKLLEYQKYRQKKLSAEYVAETQLKDGSPTKAIETLTDCLTQLKTSGMDAADIEKLSPAVEKRINDIQSAQAKADLEREQKLAIKQPWNEVKYQEARKKTQDQIAVLMEKGRELYKEGKYDEALVQAKLVQELDPGSAPGLSLEKMVNMKLAVKTYEDSQKVAERQFREMMPNSGDGRIVTDRQPYDSDKGVLTRAMGRGEIPTPFIPLKTPKEMAIERKLSQPITLTVQDQPLYRVLQDLQVMTGVNIMPDRAALADKNISLEQTLSINVDNISFKSALSLLLRQARLTYVIRDEVIYITTTDNAQGKNRLKTYSVADLVVNNVQDNGTSATNSFEEALKRHINNGSGGVSYNAPTPYTGFNSMANGQSVSNPGSGAGYANLNKMAGGPQGSDQPGKNIEGLLIHLITNTIAPGTWESDGGEGRIQYFPLGHVMVVSQVQEVQEDVQALLGALRKLQDIQISIEMRVVSVSESFYEQIGLNFDVNIRTNNNPNTINQLLLGAFTGPSQINRNLGVNGVVSGVTPGGQLTPDLSIPINSTSSQFAVPPFGGFPGTLSGDGGISLGLAFLSDIQVFMFLEAAQGDRRTHIMQAPKITVFNGQTANINVQDVMFFLTGVSVVQAGAQTFFVPQNNPFPIGVGMTVTPVVSADRRFVRVNLQPQLTNLVSPNIPLIPVQIPLPQLFDNVAGTGAIAGQPVIFQMFFQQPAFTTIQINTTVNVPDGGTVLLGGMKTLAEGRNEFGPPILSKIPYLDRLFRNTAFGRDTQSIMILVTPRIIINEEIQAELFGEIAPIPR